MSDFSFKKLLRQVGNIVAVQALAGAATELGKAVWPKVKEKLGVVLDKADELNKAKEARKELRELVKNSASHYKKVKEARQASATPAVPISPDETSAKPTNEDPPVDANFSQ